MRRAGIERLLPAAYQRAGVPGSVLWALLDVMEGLHAPDEAVLAEVDALFAPYRAPGAMVAYLARWVAMDHVVAVPRRDAPLPLPLSRLRDLVAHGAQLAAWRGTPDGLRTALELATGVTGFVLDEPADRPFHVVVRVPAAAADQVHLVGRIVEAEKPAAVTAEIVVEAEKPAGTVVEAEKPAGTVVDPPERAVGRAAVPPAGTVTGVAEPPVTDPADLAPKEPS
ncbi:phage tail protein [Micromonospora radicis]|uniref:Phage tail protein n=1 Tax=Micromonospora radicis TaxID=1894971 RepID=A0A418N1H8_9ACTN|nr:phage tail protein [Micromonospora radicis]RIV41241.1 phage tail protein [Micromonospora radicis]